MRTLGFLLAGLLAGAFSGGFGLGGAIIATPMIRAMGVTPYLAVGTTVPAILPSALTGAFTYWRAGLVDMRAASWVAGPAAAMSVVGAFFTRAVDGHLLMIATALIFFLLSIRLIPASPGREPGVEGSGDEHRSPGHYLLLGVFTGLLSGLLGVGGGFLMVPVFIKLMGFPPKVALGTSLAVISVTVLPNLLAQSMVGNIDWRAAALLTAGVVPGARVGSLLAIKASDRQLQRTVGVVLTLVAVAYGAFEVASLSSR